MQTHFPVTNCVCEIRDKLASGNNFQQAFCIVNTDKSLVAVGTVWRNAVFSSGLQQCTGILQTSLFTQYLNILRAVTFFLSLSSFSSKTNAMLSCRLHIARLFIFLRIVSLFHSQFRRVNKLHRHVRN